MQRQRLEEVLAFEDVETPRGGGGREARFGGFVVFEDDGGVGDGVCFRGEFARGGVVWFLLFDFVGGFDDGDGGRGGGGGGGGGGGVMLESCLLGGERGVGTLPVGRWWRG